ncbi:MAG: FtsX-like permease family protein [Bacteroidota bacterium]
MPSFNLNTAIAAWRQSFANHPAFGPNDLDELENHLRDHLAQRLDAGDTPEVAFKAAVAHVGDYAQTEGEYRKLMRDKLRQPAERTRLVSWSVGLLHNQMKVAIRSLAKRRSYALLNIAGLTLGLACCGLILLYAHHEWRHDRFVEDSEHIYQINDLYRANWYHTLGFPSFARSSEEEQLAQVDGLNALAEVEAAVQFHVTPRTQYLTFEGERHTVDKVLSTNIGSDIATFFSLQTVAGTLDLSAPNTVLLTRDVAERMFGAPTGAIDQVIQRDGVDWRVGGVVERVPSASHLTFDIIEADYLIPYWGAYLYAKLRPSADVERVTALATDVLFAARPERAEDPNYQERRLVPLHDLHYTADALYPIKPPGDPRYLTLFLLTGLILFVLTCTNYMNLSAAMYGARRKEIGMRKVAGASRGSVAIQFVTEAVMLAAISLPLAFGLMVVARPYLAEVMGLAPSALAFASASPVLLALGAVTLLTGLIAGTYPAVWLARIEALDLFQRGAMTRRQRLHPRHLLTGLQFALLIGLACLTLIINQQLRFVAERDLGYATEGVLVLGDIGEASDYRAFKALLADEPNVMAVGSGYAPGPRFNQIEYRAAESETVFNDANSITVDMDYFAALGITTPELEALFAPDGPDAVFAINQAAADRMGWDAPVGEAMVVDPTYYTEPTVVDAVVDDLHFFSLHETMRPLLINVERTRSWIFQVVVRVRADQLPEALAATEAAWATVRPDVPFQPAFLDDSMAALYEEEQRAGRLSMVFTGLAIILGLLGLAGLTAFLASRRTKEIGVRKVLGASVPQILGLLGREFIGLVVVAVLVAGPLTYLAAEAWLNRFAYRIDIGLDVFAVVAAAALVLTLLAVALQSLRTARANPVEALRYE